VPSIKRKKIPPARAKAAASAHSALKNKQHKSAQRKLSACSSLLPGPWQVNAGGALLFLLVTLALYAGDLRLGFFRIDDPQYVVENPWIKGFTWEHVWGVLTTPYYLNYSPLHLLSYMLDYAIGGLNAYVFHLSSNLWAGIAAGFVYLVALALTQRQAVAVAAALLFVVHPAHVEAVAWISNRKDLVATAFALPTVLAYLKYRQSHVRSWYIISLLLFLFALLGKLSVAALPAVLLALDLSIEKRPLRRSLLDKIPFCIAAIAVAAAVAHAQPSTGRHPDISVLAKAFGQSMWLLTGLGDYVLYRLRPEEGGIFSRLAGIAILLGSFLLPLLLRKRYPLVTVLIYWILFTYLPTQILPFVYPVTDRYLFMPSVGAVILVAWLLIKATDHLPKWNVAAATALVAAVSLIWFMKTVDYLSEWQDPRSVWFAATRKSQDAYVYYELGREYFEKAGSFGPKRKNPPLPVEEAKHYAAAVWKDDARLSQLLAELSQNQQSGPSEKTFKEYLQSKAVENLDEAIARKGEHVIANLFLTRAVLFVDKGDPQSAKRQFLAALGEVSRLPYSEAQQETLIRCHYNLAVLEGTNGNFKEALSWIRLAEEEQNRLGKNVIPEITANRQELESVVATLPGE
jgi:tetratricopeptide (TPR) repeat protein